MLDLSQEKLSKAIVAAEATTRWLDLQDQITRDPNLVTLEDLSRAYSEMKEATKRYREAK